MFTIQRRRDNWHTRGSATERDRTWIVNFTTLSLWGIEAASNIATSHIPITLPLLLLFTSDNTLDTQCFYWLCDATTWRHSRHHGIYTTYTLHLRATCIYTLYNIYIIHYHILTTLTIAIIALIDLYLIHYLRHIHYTLSTLSIHYTLSTLCPS